MHVLEPYLEGSSLLHRLDPRLKLLAVLASIAAITTLTPAAWPALAGVASLALAAACRARLPLRTLLARTGIALPFVAFAGLSLLFVREGTVLWSAQWGPLLLTVTREGLAAFALLLAKAWLAIWLSVLLVATTTLPALLQALWSLRVPPLICTTVALMIRYLFVLVEEAGRLQTARSARSAGDGRNIAWRVRVLGGMIGSLLIRSIERAERVHAAMVARGYDGHPCSLMGLTWRSTDTRAALIWMVVLVGLVVTGHMLQIGKVS